MITSSTFLNHWINAVTNNKSKISANWRDSVEFTNIIKDNSDSVLVSIADKLDLACYNKDYYSLDCVMYKESDVVPHAPKDSIWLSGISIAVEHENAISSGLYKETSHLLLVNAPLRVLVTYPNKDVGVDSHLAKVHDVIIKSRHESNISLEESFLLIVGYENNFEWEGYVYKTSGWKRMPVTQPINE